MKVVIRIKRIYAAWQKNGTGIKEDVLDTDLDYYIGVKTGTKYPKNEYHISKYYKAKIINVDKENKTGMYHLYKEWNDNDEENNISYKSKYIGAIVTVSKAHYCGEHTVYYCTELQEYFSDDEIKILE